MCTTGCTKVNNGLALRGLDEIDQTIVAFRPREILPSKHTPKMRGIIALRTCVRGAMTKGRVRMLNVERGAVVSP